MGAVAQAGEQRHGHAHEAGAGPSELRAKGRRLTRQRQLIWEALAAESDSHLSADDLVALVQRSCRV
jgi:Fe2+ or Zn2+ uptake regulation protein